MTVLVDMEVITRTGEITRKRFTDTLCTKCVKENKAAYPQDQYEATTIATGKHCNSCGFIVEEKTPCQEEQP